MGTMGTGNTVLRTKVFRGCVAGRAPFGGGGGWAGGAIMEKKTRSVQYALRWRPVGNRWRLVCNRWRLVGNRWRLVCNRWRLVCNRWRLVGNRWRLVGNRWRLVGNRWRLVCNRWRLVGSHQTSESGCHSKKKKGGERPYGTPWGGTPPLPLPVVLSLQRGRRRRKSFCSKAISAKGARENF